MVIDKFAVVNKADTIGFKCADPADGWYGFWRYKGFLWPIRFLRDLWEFIADPVVFRLPEGNTPQSRG